jgi:hypothetical protein
MAAKRKHIHESMAPVLEYIRAGEGNEADFAKVLDIDHGRFTNWKRRGVPQKMHAVIAAKIGKSTDQYLAEIGRPTGAAPLKPDEQEMLVLYRKASPRWRMSLRYLATLHADVQDEMAESLNALYADIATKHASNTRVEETYGLPPNAKVKEK